jgi:acyl-CoA thioester hydrolase
MLEVLRSSVNTWDCDHMGHMNVRHYFGRANEGLSVLCLQLGLGPRALQEKGLLLRARDQHIRFSKELRPGAGYVMRAGGIDHTADTLSTYEELRTVSDEVSATIVTELGLLERGTQKVVQWPANVREGLAQHQCELPSYAAPRGVVARASRARPTRTEAIARGMFPGYLGPVTPVDCDADGVMRESACIGRIADGIAHFFTRLQNGGGRPEGIGGAALEYRFVFHAWPRLSDVIEVRSALSMLNNKAMQVTHYMFDLATNECFASSQAVVVWFDLVARKAIAFPDDVRPQLQEKVIEGLTI